MEGIILSGFMFILASVVTSIWVLENMQERGYYNKWTAIMAIIPVLNIFILLFVQLVGLGLQIIKYYEEETRSILSKMDNTKGLSDRSRED